MSYEQFLDAKLRTMRPTGLSSVSNLAGPMFPHQVALTTWALKRGRSAIFARTGLGKTRMELAWADAIHRETGRPVVILTPLAVAAQMRREAMVMGLDASVVREPEDQNAPICICNYERLHKLDVRRYAGVVLDESSIIKHHTAKTLALLIETFGPTPYKLCATATPAPNDWTELGNHAEFLGICSRSEMLAEYFCHDGGETQVWRLKGHARQAFWRWVSSWGAMVQSPADLGFDGSAYELPPLTVREHRVEVEAEAAAGSLFALEASTLTERRAAKRGSLQARVDACAALVNADREHWIVWCELNAEGDAMEAAIPGAVQVSGSDPVEYKEEVALWFSGGKCLCKSPMFRGKLAAWRTIPSTSGNTTCGTESDESQSLASINGGTQEKDGNTTPSITQRTKHRSQSKPLPTESELQSHEKQNAGPNTPQTQSDSSARSKRGKLLTHASDSRSACEDLGSRLSSMNPHSPSSAEYAQSVSQQSRREPEDSTSTIATNQGASEGCCAQNVISDSVSSETQQNFSAEPQCICGHTSGRRTLVSKSSIFGFGLNWQHCARMAFVGATDSWESYYQSISRCQRFGQKRGVEVHIFSGRYEESILRNLQRKEADAAELGAELARETHDAVMAEVIGQQTRETNTYNAAKRVKPPSWLTSEAA